MVAPPDSLYTEPGWCLDREVDDANTTPEGAGGAGGTSPDRDGPADSPLARLPQPRYPLAGADADRPGAGVAGRLDSATARSVRPRHRCRRDAALPGRPASRRADQHPLLQRRTLVSGPARRHRPA